MREILPVLDVDDTIIAGSTWIHLLAYSEGLKAVGLNIAGEALLRETEPNWGGTHDTQFAYMISRNAGRENLENKVQKAGKVFMQTMGEVMTKGAGIIGQETSTLELFSPRPALATGLHPDILVSVFDTHKIDIESFYPIVTAYDLEPDQVKPDPYMLQEVLSRRNQIDKIKNAQHLEYESGDIAMVGDSANDMRMANRAGAICIAVLTGRLTRDDARNMQHTSVNIDYIVEDISYVPAVIEKINIARGTITAARATKAG